jgi:MFS family permease
MTRKELFRVFLGSRRRTQTNVFRFLADNPNSKQATMRFKELHPTTRRLLATRFARSVPQGALLVDLALFLHALGWSGTVIGATLAATGLFRALGSLLVGPVTDRLRRRPFMIGNEVVSLLCGVAAFLATSPWLLVPAIVVGGFGRGASGSAGPFSPAEQAWLAEAVSHEWRGRIYSLNMSLGFYGMALGALAATLPAWWMQELGRAGAYRPLFLLVVVGSLINIWLLAGARESQRAAARRMDRQVVQEKTHPDRRKRENRMLLRVVQINIVNGLSIGLVSPLISYWFALRFGVGPASIAPFMALMYGVTGVASLLTGRLGEKIGLTRSVVGTRAVGVAMIGILPSMPFFTVAALVYLVRLATGGGSVGARQAQIISLVGDERRGFATSLNTAAFQFPQSIGPAIAGGLLDAGFFAAPFYIAAALQVVYVVAYGRIFGDYENRHGMLR